MTELIWGQARRGSPDTPGMTGARYACCPHCVHGPGWVHTIPCLAGCNDDGEDT